MPTPLSSETRTSVRELLTVGAGRNQIARIVGISPGSVTKIARECNHYFPQCEQTAVASHARQIDAWALRIDKEAELESQLSQIDPSRRRRRRKLELRIDNLHRHTNGRYS